MPSRCGSLQVNDSDRSRWCARAGLVQTPIACLRLAGRFVVFILIACGLSSRVFWKRTSFGTLFGSTGSKAIPAEISSRCQLSEAFWWSFLARGRLPPQNVGTFFPPKGVAATFTYSRIKLVLNLDTRKGQNKQMRTRATPPLLRRRGIRVWLFHKTDTLPYISTPLILACAFCSPSSSVGPPGDSVVSLDL